MPPRILSTNIEFDCSECKTMCTVKVIENGQIPPGWKYGKIRSGKTTFSNSKIVFCSKTCFDKYYNENKKHIIRKLVAERNDRLRVLTNILNEFETPEGFYKVAKDDKLWKSTIDRIKEQCGIFKERNKDEEDYYDWDYYDRH